MAEPTIGEIFSLKTPKPHHHKEGKPDGSNPDLMMGLELETEGCDHTQDWYVEYLSKLGVQVTIDNSLRGENIDRRNNVEGNAFEFITKPMTQQSIHALLPKYFELTKFNESNFSERCSVHAHLNCLDLTVEQVSSLALIYTVVEDVLFKFAGAEREHNIFCVPWNQCRINYNLVETMTTSDAHAADTFRRWQKYTALNLQPLRDKGTVEFRHLPGTASIPRLVTWTNILGQMHKYAVATELNALVDEIKNLNSTSHYEKFFKESLGEYLPYNDEYRSILERGVLCAKYSLTTWRKDKEKIKTKVAKQPTVGLFDDYVERRLEDEPDYNQAFQQEIQRVRLEQEQVRIQAQTATNPYAQGIVNNLMTDTAPMWRDMPAQAQHPQARAVPRAHNRLNPWPPVGRVLRTDLWPWNTAESVTLLERDSTGVRNNQRVTATNSGATFIVSMPEPAAPAINPR